jgi:hypothetical protein
MDMVYLSLYKTETAGKLAREINQTKPGMFEDMDMTVGKLESELKYAQNRDVAFS